MGNLDVDGNDYFDVERPPTNVALSLQRRCCMFSSPPPTSSCCSFGLLFRLSCSFVAAAAVHNPGHRREVSDFRSSLQLDCFWHVLSSVLINWIESRKPKISGQIRNQRRRERSPISGFEPTKKKKRNRVGPGTQKSSVFLVALKLFFFHLQMMSDSLWYEALKTKLRSNNKLSGLTTFLLVRKNATDETFSNFFFETWLFIHQLLQLRP